MTSSTTNEKLRAIALTALMVLSVFAMGVSITGTTAANHGGDPIVVDKNNPDPTNGTYGTISGALAHASSDDVIEVREGVYNETFQIGVENVTLVGDPGAVIAPEESDLPGNGRIVDIRAPNATIVGLTVDGPVDGFETVPGTPSVGIYIGGGNHARNTNVSGNTIQNVWTGVQTVSNNEWATDSEIEGNDIKHVSTAISVQSDDITLRDNRIDDASLGLGFLTENTGLTVENNDVTTRSGARHIGIPSGVNGESGAEYEIATVILRDNPGIGVAESPGGVREYDRSIENRDSGNYHSSINQALGNASAENEISVTGGTHNETIQFRDDGVRLIGIDGATIQPSDEVIENLNRNNIVDFHSRSNVTLDGFTIIGNRDGSNSGPVGVSVSGEDNTVQRTTIKDVLTGIQTNSKWDPANNTFGESSTDGVIIERNDVEGVQVGISIQSDDALVHNNTISSAETGIAPLNGRFNINITANDLNDINGAVVKVSANNVDGNGSVIDDGTVLLRNNDLSDGGFGVDNGAGVDVDAELNWWGRSNGPTSSYLNDTSVDYTPWYSDADMSDTRDEVQSSGSSGGSSSSSDSDDEGDTVESTGSAETEVQSVGREVSVTVENAQAGDSVSVQRNDEDVTNEVERHGAAMESVETTFEQETDFEMTVTSSTAKPDATIPDPPSDSGAAGYVNVEHSTNDDAVGEVRFNFRVTADRLEQQGIGQDEVVIYRYDDSGEWTALETTFDGVNDDGTLRFQAVSPGLSVFAIGGPQAQQEEPTEEPTETTADEPTESDPSTSTPEETTEQIEEPGGFSLVTIIVAIALAIVVVALFVLTRRRY